MHSLSLQLLQEGEQYQGGTLPCSTRLQKPVLSRCCLALNLRLCRRMSSTRRASCGLQAGGASRRRMGLATRTTPKSRCVALSQPHFVLSEHSAVSFRWQ